MAEERKMNNLKNLSEAMIPKRYKGKKLSDFKLLTQKHKEVYEKLKYYAKNFKSCAEKGCSLILCGSPGTGKTMMACILARAAISHGYKAKYITAFKIFQDIKATYGNNQSAFETKKLINGLIEIEFLVIDEIGVQFNTDHERTMFFQILDGRYQELKPTVIISNEYNLVESGYIDQRTEDRFFENGGGKLFFDWDSYRKVA